MRTVMRYYNLNAHQNTFQVHAKIVDRAHTKPQSVFILAKK